MLAGKPLIKWTIEAGLESSVIDRLIVSTDDIEISEVARACGADVPFMRPSKLATDFSSAYSVLEHSYQTLQKQGESYDYIILLQPTSPLRTSRHIDEASKIIKDKAADGVLGVTEINHPIQWCNTLPESKEMVDFVDTAIVGTQSQQFKRYCLNGAIAATCTNRMLKEKSHIYGSSMFAFIMERAHSIDIDSALDFEIAEFLISKQTH